MFNDSRKTMAKTNKCTQCTQASVDNAHQQMQIMHISKCWQCTLTSVKFRQCQQQRCKFTELNLNLKMFSSLGLKHLLQC